MGMQIFGHRGAKGLALENTRDAFEQAIKNKADGIEFDLRKTLDDQLVVIHDKSTRRVTGRRLSVEGHSLKALQSIRTKNGETLLTFPELLEQLKGRRIQLDIEMKSNGTADLLQPYLKELLKNGYTYEDFFVSSFKISEVRRLRELNQDVRLAVIHAFNPFKFLIVYRKLDLWGAGFAAYIAWPPFLRVSKRLGLYTYAYRVNSVRTASILKHLNIDMVITDNPHLLAKLR